MKKISYNAKKYQFKEIIEKTLGIMDLSNIHIERSDLLPQEKLNFETETKTGFHDLFYSKLKSGWKEIENAYTEFIKNEITKQIPGKFVFQSFPSVRFHLPNDQAIHYWHYDSDKDHMHPEWEINFHLSLTNIKDPTQAMWVETVPGLKDFKPMIMSYGEYFVFNGNKCTHGNKTNKTNKTRVSFDFRILPIERYTTDGAKSSATKNRKFIVGDYYREL
tara:strand:+ start:221 stop:877 length:657 start_codon:yes stop_codon:yes gene_type:complete